MSTHAAIKLEQHLDPEGDTIGWLARYGEHGELWCGEMSRAEYLRQPDETRAALRDDLGWYLLDYERRETGVQVSVLARVCKPTGLDVLRTVALGRLAERDRSPPEFETRVVPCGPAISGRPCGAPAQAA